MKAYYAYSRACLEGALLDLVLLGTDWRSVLEVGCGAGHVVKRLQERFYRRATVRGCDVSQTAVERARRLSPDLGFFVADFTTSIIGLSHQGRYDVVILNQMLWYVLDRLPVVFENAMALLTPRGHFIIQMAFLNKQEYGREIVNGFNGLLEWVLDRQPGAFQIVSASYDSSSRFAPYHDGLLVLQATH